MSKTISIIVIALVVIAGGIFLFIGGSQTPQESSTETPSLGAPAPGFGEVSEKSVASDSEPATRQAEKFESAAAPEDKIIASGESGKQKISQEPEKETDTAPAKQKLRVNWTPLPDPPGKGGVWSISISPSNPDVAYLATRDFNVLKTVNGGNTWEIIGEGLFGAHIFSNIEIDPEDPNRVYLSNGAVYISSDGGNSWRAVPVEILGSGESLGIISLEIDGTNPNILYAGEDTGAIHQSIDRGKSWKELAVLEGNGIRSIIVDKNNPATLYALVGDKGVFKSVDQGKTWNFKSNGLTSLFDSRYLATDHQDSNVLYFLTGDAVYKTTNGGESWSKIGDFAFQNTGITLSVSSDPKIIFMTTDSGKVLKSSNAGETWQEVFKANGGDIKNHAGFNFAVAVDPTDSNRVYLSTDSSFYISRDGGVTWQESTSGMDDDITFAINYARDTKTLWVGNFWTKGVFTTKNDGVNWEFLKKWRSQEPADHYPMNISVDPTNGNSVIISGAHGLKKTTDNGATWSTLGGGLYLYGAHAHGLKRDPNNPNVIYVGTAPGWGQENPEAKIYKSTNNGQTWKELKNGFPQGTANNVYALDVAKSDSNIVFLAANGHEGDEPHVPALGIYKSTDGGNTWEAKNNGLPRKDVFSIAIHPKNPDIVYAGLGHRAQDIYSRDKGLYWSTDGGNSWKKINGLPSVQPSKILFHPANPNIILVSFGDNVCGACGLEYPSGGGVYGTDDGGKSWYNLTLDFSEEQKRAMDIVFADDSTIYAATHDGIIKGQIK